MNKKNNKKLRVFEAFAGIGAQASALKRLNINYEIVGISEAKITDASVEGMCYAIPIKENLDLIHELMGTDSLL